MIFLKDQPASGARPATVPPPVGGFTTAAPLMAMKPSNAVLLENFYPFPEKLQMRSGYVEHTSGFSSPALRLIPYAPGSASEKLFAATAAGVYDITTAGALGSAAVALTNGEISSALISTGANYYLILVNGTDTLKRYDGTSWTSVALFGALDTSTLSCVEVYRQRLYFAQTGSLIIHYLPVNSISGTPVEYDLGAIFRQGGYIVSMATWTIDGGVGPEDQLVIVTSKGEIAVFAGNDPSNIAAWGLRGVYYIGKPLGTQPLFKYGGDLLFLSENGLYPLSTALQSTAIERVRAVSENIRQYLNDAAQNFRSSEGWQVMALPEVPLLLVNIPASPRRKQVVMHAQTGAWSTLVGWDAYSFARLRTEIYFSTAASVMRLTGTSDAGSNITATMIQGYSTLGSALAKQVTAVRPVFVTGGNFQYSLGVINDFGTLNTSSLQTVSDQTPGALWGTGLWGSAIWGGTSSVLQRWATIPNTFSVYKALYLQIVSNETSVEYLGSQVQYLQGAYLFD